MGACFRIALLAAALAAASPAVAAGAGGYAETGRSIGSGILREALALAVDERGHLFAADAMTGKVFRFDTAGAVVEFERPAGSSAAFPIDIAAFGPFVYVLDYDAARVLRYDYKGAYLDVLLTFDPDRHRPVSIDEGGGGRLVTTDIEMHDVTVWSPLLDVELSFGEYGWVPGRFDRPVGAVLLDDGGIAVLDAGNRRVQLFSPAGGWTATVVPAGGGFVSPRSIAAGPGGELFVADPGAGAVFLFDGDGLAAGRIDSWNGTPIEPAAAATGRRGRLYVSDLASRSILVYRRTSSR
ncbi:MAG: NHL repeat-containing protein [Candidatus Krumholzibacteriota bacterium]|nr:NHL repeat-containing protein [Candidatus Krumholzibacteriota bacterium]